jgi:hypothetical protein
MRPKSNLELELPRSELIGGTQATEHARQLQANHQQRVCKQNFFDKSLSQHGTFTAYKHYKVLEKAMP